MTPGMLYTKQLASVLGEAGADIDPCPACRCQVMTMMVDDDGIRVRCARCGTHTRAASSAEKDAIREWNAFSAGAQLHASSVSVPFKWSEWEEDIMTRLANARLSNREIAGILGRGVSAITARLWKLRASGRQIPKRRHRMRFPEISEMHEGEVRLIIEHDERNVVRIQQAAFRHASRTGTIIRTMRVRRGLIVYHDRKKDVGAQS